MSDGEGADVSLAEPPRQTGFPASAPRPPQSSFAPLYTEQLAWPAGSRSLIYIQRLSLVVQTPKSSISHHYRVLFQEREDHSTQRTSLLIIQDTVARKEKGVVKMRIGYRRKITVSDDTVTSAVHLTLKQSLVPCFLGESRSTIWSGLCG